MREIITKRQLYKLKQSLHLGEAPLPEETTSKPLTMFSPRETIEECPRVQTRLPFYRRLYDVMTVRHWNVPQLRGGSTSRGTDWIIIA